MISIPGMRGKGEGRRVSDEVLGVRGGDEGIKGGGSEATRDFAAFTYQRRGNVNYSIFFPAHVLMVITIPEYS